MFEDKLKRVNPELLNKHDEINFNKVNINKVEEVPFASYHSKMILYEFNDRLRVIVSSANLTLYMWNKI